MVPRKRRTRGHIEPLPSGSYRAVVYAGIDPLTRRPRYLRETAKDYDLAQAALTRLQLQVDEDRHPKSAITVTQTIAQWLAVADLADTTRERYEDLIRLYVQPTLGDLYAGKLDVEMLETFYARLQHCNQLCSGRRPPGGHTCRPLADSTVRKIHFSALRCFLTRAARTGLPAHTDAHDQLQRAGGPRSWNACTTACWRSSPTGPRPRHPHRTGATRRRLPGATTARTQPSPVAASRSRSRRHAPPATDTNRGQAGRRARWS